MKTFGPYTPLRWAGNTAFISGQIGVDPESKTAPNDVREQTHMALRNMRQVLADSQLTLNQIVKTTIYVTDMGDFAAVNEVYQTYFDEPRPARSTVAVKELPRVAGNQPILVEIDALAYRETS